MKKFIVDADFWTVFPEAEITVLVVKGINNKCMDENYDYFKSLLQNGTKEAVKFLDNDVFSQNKVIDEWRKAYGKFKTKKGARSSIEALLKRAKQGKEFLPINPLVDIYNSISLKYAIPCGGEDMNKIVGDLHLGKAKGGEGFFPLGAEEDSPALPEEIIYYDEEGAVCRCWNWREAQRTMLTDTTTEAVLVMEAINQEQAQRAKVAIQELKELIASYFDVEGMIHKVTKEISTVILSK